MKHAGFILIEVLLAAAISSVLCVVLATALYQISRAQSTAERIIDVHERATLFYTQLSRDFSGAFVPMQAEIKKDEQKKDATDKKEAVDNKKKSDQQVTNQKKPAEQDKKKPVDQPKPIEKLFSDEYAENGIRMLTWLSTNPLNVYWGAKTGRAIPRISRVVYRIAPDAQRSELWQLERQESTQLDLRAYAVDAEKAITPFVLIDGIVALEVQLFAQQKNIPEKTEAKEKKETVAEQPPMVWKSFIRWDTQEVHELIKQERLPRIPEMMEVKLVLRDHNKKDHTFTYTFARVTDVAPLPDKKSAPEKKEKTADKKDTEKKNDKKTSKEFSVSGMIQGMIEKTR